MLKMVDGTGVIGVDMICPLGISTPQPPNYDRVELEGTGMLVLPNSLDAQLEGLELGGKTEQVQTSGKNLFDTKTYRDMNGCEIINNNQISFIQNLAKITYETKLDSGDYRISFKRKKYSSFTIRNGESVLNTNGGENDYGYNIKLSAPAVISVEFASGQNPNAEQRYVYDIQLEKGTDATPYEPYTGGKPSPSPEYPQEIKNSGKWNEEKQKYEIDVKVTGRNLFNGKLLKGKFITDDMNVVSDLVTMNTFDKPVEIEPNTDYVISANGVIWEGNINVYDENGKKIVQHFTGKFKTPSNAKYIRASISNARAPIDSKIQMEYGTAMNEFEQYHQPQVLTLTSDRPITKWDRLEKIDGIWNWVFQSKRTFLTEKTQWSFTNKDSNIYFYIILNDSSGGKQSSLCKEFKNVDLAYSSDHRDKLSIYCDHPSVGIEQKYFRRPNETIQTLEQWKTWLTENPIEILYKTKEPELIPLSPSEQNAIRALKTYYPTTVITVDGGELDPDIKVTYRKEI